VKKSISDLNFTEGEMLLMHKPIGWTSFALVAQLKKWTKAKIGHAGTLDPLAEGLVICCTGKKTKLLSELTGLDKVYTGTITLGAITPTYDLESAPEQFKEIPTINHDILNQVAQPFIGTIAQLPPIHSAIKQEGKALYELARDGREIAVKERKVTIYNISWTKIDLPHVSFQLHCSSGTYIRSFAFDIGQALGCGAYLSSLTRTHIGKYALADAYSIDEMADYYGSKMNARIIQPHFLRAQP
jgi:tRNA pseudouridine 55 synthase